VLYVIIAANSQAEAALQTPPLEDLAAICSGHALAKAVHTHTPADPGLVWTFRCHSLSSKISIKTQQRIYPPGFSMVPIPSMDRDGWQL
jgi:hypothetical protein